MMDFHKHFQDIWPMILHYSLEQDDHASILQQIVTNRLVCTQFNSYMNQEGIIPQDFLLMTGIWNSIQCRSLLSLKHVLWLTNTRLTDQHPRHRASSAIMVLIRSFLTDFKRSLEVCEFVFQECLYDQPPRGCMCVLTFLRFFQFACDFDSVGQMLDPNLEKFLPHISLSPYATDDPDFLPVDRIFFNIKEEKVYDLTPLRAKTLDLIMDSDGWVLGHIFVLYSPLEYLCRWINSGSTFLHRCPREFQEEAFSYIVDRLVNSYNTDSDTHSMVEETFSLLLENEWTIQTEDGLMYLVVNREEPYLRKLVLKSGCRRWLETLGMSVKKNKLQ